ncbi:hypothetical protein A3K48_07545 [candidate division WOR-1 bacterium RIFOXYA12_FULL_52_29]|uniref:DUF3800 domain-containing protein n=1 Tax=candidate division WOR-1 bacterium RIFOXYC12_FULL_54_18 TaxID=1802584 RepID=A0A1F4T7L0_UNCSA|nr:MAG: hypothetical protein A3K44_07545 [candidate division WOR-1 bacterium RIFOXYA2_FULL_51_19]OGC18364.1 MAG: hypothetical protein A3K48_07545 [candidate division WOR-1 bacterium RIFOXYA12_FULL_52_29]OGC27219.1 MAG: hypothetical protein A3K32_07540 [candidate division WOR-1 bacterium RIFOXYB2_FULL_45_9]OGC28781.1 MAG: hypothetical protein A3K49_07545 [candidate division WOR-1 bacterium RIFOXYC12_FULL_54_18]OGC30765.1 MAG: hypothetical protein A2346_05070 [candidate division WOR-1 bacterium R
MDKKIYYCFLDERFEEESAIIGGYLIDDVNLKVLFQNIVRIKKENNLPLETNMKWRHCKKNKNLAKDVFSLLSKNNGVTSFVSMVWTGKGGDKFQGWKNCLSNLLERLIINLDQLKNKNDESYPSVFIVFDMLPGGVAGLNKKKLWQFLKIYLDYYQNKHSFLKNELPSLKEFSAFDSLVIAPARSCSEVQLADCFVGMCGDFLYWNYKNIDSDSKEIIKANLPKIDSFARDRNGDVMGCGIKIPDSEKQKVIDKLNELSFKVVLAQ